MRDIEKIVKNLNKPEKVKKVETEKDLEFIYQNLEEKMKISLGTKVVISSKGKGTGKIEIEFYSHDELERLMELMNTK